MEKAGAIIAYLAAWLKELINTILEAVDFVNVNFEKDITLPITK